MMNNDGILNDNFEGDIRIVDAIEKVILQADTGALSVIDGNCCEITENGNQNWIKLQAGGWIMLSI